MSRRPSHFLGGTISNDVLAPQRAMTLMKSASVAASTSQGRREDVLFPQRAMASASRDKRSTPGGVGLDSQTIRNRMVDRLRSNGITDLTVLQVMTMVPRHMFVEPALIAQAYEDAPLPIGMGQTISKPTTVARSLQSLRQYFSGKGRLKRVLEIGSGCGYQTALLACFAEQVISIERIQVLHQLAKENLFKIAKINLPGFRLQNVRLIWGDGTLGFHPSAPFDAIISAAGGDAVPKAWWMQLSPGGVIVAPVGGKFQQLLLLRKGANGEMHKEVIEDAFFVPLKSGTD